MDTSNAIHSFPDFSPAKLFRRCVSCPPTTPSCPVCNKDEVCVQLSQTCDQCAYRKCVNGAAADVTINPQHGLSGPSKGAMAGGVIGGVLFIAIVTYLVWRFFIKNKRTAFIDDFFEDELEEHPIEKPEDRVAGAIGRPSLEGRESVASTVFTRASNVIPIAFVPGVIDRSGAAPPVPPVPIPTTTNATQPGSTLLSPYADMHGDTYFMPDDLRESTYSGFTDDTSSVTARSTTDSSGVRGSVASTVYRADVADVSPVHVQTAQRARAAVISVHSSQNSGRASAARVPAVPRIDYDRYKDLAAARSRPGSSVLGAASPAKRLSSALNQDAFALNTAVAGSPASSLATTAPLRLDIPGATSAGRSGPVRAGPAPHLAAVIEEATRRASRQPLHGGLGSLPRTDSPFGDQYAIEEDE